MREIKFRAWHKKTKQMLSVWELTWTDESGLKVWLKDWLPETLASNEGVTYLDAIPAKELVLLQFTGLKDRAEREIYDGDILINVPEFSQGYPFEVEWENPNSCSCCGQCSGWNVDVTEKHKIIGNKFENPELLK